MLKYKYYLSIVKFLIDLKKKLHLTNNNCKRYVELFQIFYLLFMVGV